MALTCVRLDQGRGVDAHLGEVGPAGGLGRSSILPATGGAQREGRLGRATASRGITKHRHTLMSVLAPAVGAVLAAILESSVLTHLQVGSVRPDLVFAVGIAVAMVLGFESGVTWAFVGGLSLDLLLPGRALGSSALTLLLVVAAALLVARVLWPPRMAFVAGTTFVLTFAYQATVLGLLTLIQGAGAAGVALTDLAVIGLLNALIAGAAVPVLRALDLRFGEPERLAW